MWKIIGDLLETHPLSFVPFLQPGLEFATYFGFAEEGRTVVFERVAIHALNLLKGIILCPEFRTPRTLDENNDHGTGKTQYSIFCMTLRADRVYRPFYFSKWIGYTERRTSYRDTTPVADPLTFEAAKVKSAFFSEETLSVLVRVLVTRFLPLSTAELESWNEDPEEFGMN